jgi:hypothetical protein
VVIKKYQHIIFSEEGKALRTSNVMIKDFFFKPGKLGIIIYFTLHVFYVSTL